MHPLILDPLTTLFSEGDEYRAVYIDDVEPEELNISLITSRKSGYIKIEATVKQPAGDIEYNGYIYETANLLYIYSGVGPSSLSIAIVVYTDIDIAAPNVNGFGIISSPTINCNYSSTTTKLSNCISPFNLYHDLDIISECNQSWIYQFDIDIINSTKLEGYEYLSGNSVSFNYAEWYLQPGGWNNVIDAINNEITCDELMELIN